MTPNKKMQLSSLVVRDCTDRTIDGELDSAPELQFQVTNICGRAFAGIDVEVNYYSSDGEFAGTDYDLRVDPLPDGDFHTFSLIVDPPATAARAELRITAKPITFLGRFPFWLKTLLLIAAVVGILFAD